MRKFLTRYWFEFRSSASDVFPPGLTAGCGVTAYNYDDAITILGRLVFRGQCIPEILVERENIDIRDLDQLHVIPNMKDPSLRGVWFPMGY